MAVGSHARERISPLKAGLASGATLALVVTSMLMGGSAAHAANTQLGPDDIHGYEVGTDFDPETGEEFLLEGYNYDEWHIGSIPHPGFTSEDSLEFGNCSVTVLDVPSTADTGSTITQVMKGFSIGERPSTIDEIREAIESVEIDVESGSVTLQFPFFAFERYEDEDSETGYTTEHYWDGTWRNINAFTGGVGAITDETMLTNSSGHFLGDVDFDTLMSEMRTAVETADRDLEIIWWFELLGIGFTGTPGTVVNSISFLGETYYFGEGDCLPEVPGEVIEPPAETPVETPAKPVPPVVIETGAR